MSGILRRRPSPAFVISLIALFVSLGGVSYGLATGSIDGREVKNSTIRTQDLRNNDVRGRDIRNSTIRSRDVGLDGLGGADIKESRLGTVPRAATLGGIGPAGFYRYGSSISGRATVRGAFGGSGSLDVVTLPLPAPANLTNALIGFAPGAGAPGEQDSRCSGSSSAPTAPRGMACVYPIGPGADLSGAPLGAGTASRYGFRVEQTPGTGEFSGTWAYTAP